MYFIKCINQFAKLIKFYITMCLKYTSLHILAFIDNENSKITLSMKNKDVTQLKN